MRPVLTELYRGLAEADWLTPARARKALTLLGLTTVAYLIALLALSWPRGIDPGGTPLGADFSCFYAASRLVLDGHAGWVWTREHLLPVERALFGDPYYYPYLYPPPYQFVCAPLALVPYFPALAAWLVGTTAVYLRMAKCWLGERGDWLLMLAFPALLVNLRNGQNGCLTAALFGLGAWFASRRPWLAGVFVGCLVIKPTLAVLFPLAFLITGNWRAFVSAGLTATALCLAAYVAFGAEAWTQFFAAMGYSRQIMEDGVIGFSRVQSLFAAVRLLGGGNLAGYAAQGLSAAVVAWLLWRLRGRLQGPAMGAALACATLLATPYVMDYDLVLLVLPLAWLFSRAREDGFLPWEKLALLAGFLAPIAVRPLTMLGLPTMPLIAMLLLACIVHRVSVRSAAGVTAGPVAPGVALA